MPLGIYERGCGLDNVTLSWGHDEYMYLVARSYFLARISTSGEPQGAAPTLHASGRGLRPG